MRLLLVSAATTIALALATPTSQAARTSLPRVASGARPGPNLLYAPAVDAPQLQNAGPWRAPPILVSGAEAYRDREFLYQDFLYDDHGGTSLVPDPSDPFSEAENLFAPKHGTLSYPTDTAVFANNAADLVELRVKPLASATAFRVTLNTLEAADRTAFTIALGDSRTARPWPHAAGVASPAALFLTVHGAVAELRDAATGRIVSPTPTARADMARRQIDVRIPHAAWNPGNATVRMAAGVGLWNPSGGGYLKPSLLASATHPGGASPSGEALFNMAFRTNEPIPHINYPGIANTTVEGAVGVFEDGSWWRERRQGDVLASGDVTPFSARVDFAKLRRGTNDESVVPKTGHIDRIFASRFDLGQGVDYDKRCILNLVGTSNECTGRYLGRLQPYGVYVPMKPPPRKGFGLVISMHGLSANYNEFLGSNEAEELGERGTGSILASPESRGPDGSYKSYAEADVFEMWADVARHYRLDPELTDVTGYSMGGGGTYRLANRWPDLWARAFPIVGPPTSADSFRSLRNIPVMAWYGQNDELVGPELSEMAFFNAARAGIRYDHWVFVPAGHITEGNNDEYAPAATFFGDHTVDRNPAHVTYSLDPGQDTRTESQANHAYWVSGLTARRGATTGLIDARSHAFGAGDPTVLPLKLGLGTLNGGSHGPIPYTRRTYAWGPTPSEPRANQLDVTLTNIGSAIVDAGRAGLGCDAVVNVVSDGPARLAIGGCDIVADVARGRSTVGCAPRHGLVLHLPTGLRGHRVTQVSVSVAGRKARVVRGRSLSVPVSFAGIATSSIPVRILSTLSTGQRVASVRMYRVCPG